MLQQLLAIAKQSPLKQYNSIEEWSADYYQSIKDKTPFDRAMIGGFQCQQFSFAFMAGYQAALEKMFPAIAPNELKALCVSEAKGGHPKAIQTTLINHQITGVKTYITAGSDAAHLLVLCKTEKMVNGRPLLKMVHLPRQTDKLSISHFELPFMLEVKHGKSAMEGVQITADQILEGDGYSQYAKPFRTLEDILVATAYQAMLLRQAIEHQWEEEVRDQLVLNLFTLKNLLAVPPSDMETHLLLATQEQHFKNLLPRIASNITNHSPAHFKADWDLNQPVIALGKKIKQLRQTKARKLFRDEELNNLPR